MINKEPKVLIYDLEVDGVQALSADRGYTVCFGWMWLTDKKPTVWNLLDFPASGGKLTPKNCQEDRHLIQAAHEKICEADLLVAHFGDKFDRPYLNTRLLIQHLKPLPIVRQVDTCIFAQKNLKFSSNRLGNHCSCRGPEYQKQDKRSGWPNWWLGALRGDHQSIKDISAYCAHDVMGLKANYLWMRPWMPDKMIYNYQIGTALNPCPACGGKIRKCGWYNSPVNSWQRYKCNDCGHWTHGNTVIARAGKIPK